MTEFAPNLPAFPDPEEVLRGAFDKIKEFFSPPESPALEINEPGLVLEGLRAVKDESSAEKSERRVTHIDPENTDDIKKRDRVSDSDRRHYHGGKGSASSGQGKVRRSNPEKDQR